MNTIQSGSECVPISKEPISVLQESQDTLRSLLLRALQTWVLAQRLPQRILADRLEIPRSAISEIINGKSGMSAEKMLDLWASAGGEWEFRLTLGRASEKVASTHFGG
jgi:predicted XRE-type DNA-binding protein